MIHRERGMSVVEVLVAAAILGGALVCVARTVDALTATGRLSEWKAVATSENFRALAALRADLRVAYAEPGGENGYEVDPGGEWISYRLVDGEVLTPSGSVQPALSPRIYVFLDRGRLIRAVVDAGLLGAPPEDGDPIQEVRVLARDVARAVFGNPLDHDGAFLVRLTTLVGTPGTDQHATATNQILVSSVNQPPLQIEDVPVAPAVPMPVTDVDLDFQAIVAEIDLLIAGTTDKHRKDELGKARTEVLKAIAEWTTKGKDDPIRDLSRFGYDPRGAQDALKHALDDLWDYDHDHRDHRLPPEQMLALGERITAIGRQIAVNEITAAIARDGRTKELDQALDRLRQGDVRRALKEYERAQDDYKKALEKALKS